MQPQRKCSSNRMVIMSLADERARQFLLAALAIGAFLSYELVYYYFAGRVTLLPAGAG